MKTLTAIACLAALLPSCANVGDSTSSLPPGLTAGDHVGFRYHSDGVAGTMENVRICERGGHWVLVESSTGKHWVDMRKVVWVSLDSDRRLEQKRKRLARIDEQLQKTPRFLIKETQERNPAYTPCVQAVFVVENELKQIEARFAETHPTARAKKQELVAAREMLARTPQFVSGPRNQAPNPDYERLLENRALLEREIEEFGTFK